MALFAVFIPPALLVVLVALGWYEELMLPPLADEPEAPEGAALTGPATGNPRQSAARSGGEPDARQV